jgi:ABC-type polysaccharide/polyol phosphate transport system ATPase subunit
VAHINLSGVTVAYPMLISQRQQSAFANAAHALSFGRYGKGVGVDHIIAIDDLTLDLPSGSRVGLIGRFHGMRGGELKEAVAEAAAFTELGPFLEMPVRTYSSGMMARLAFAIATAQHSDIMLIDEVIATGDAHFIHKAVDRVRTVCANSGVTMVASHMPDLLADFCDEAIWMHAGKIRARGPVMEVWEQYAAEAV